MLREKKKNPMFSKPDIPSGFTVISLHFEIFSLWTEDFVYHDASFSWEYLKGRSISVQVLDTFNHRRALIVFSGLGS